MKLYTVIFWYQGREVCSCVKEGENAGFALACNYPGVVYDDVTASEAATD